MLDNSKMSVTNEATKNPSLQAAGQNTDPAEAKAGRNTVQTNREPSHWDFRENGLLFWERGVRSA